MNQLQVIEQRIEAIQPDFEKNLKSIGVSSIKFAQEAAYAMAILKENKYLAGMPIDTIIQAVLNTSLTGLSLCPIKKLAYLIPRKGKCLLEPSYKGLRKVLEDAGVVQNIDTGVVYKGEPFEITRGTDPKIIHGIATSQRGDILGAYSIANLSSGKQSIEWMYADEIMSIMQRSESVKARRGSPWDTDTGEMTRKTVLRRHTKQLPIPDSAIAAHNVIQMDIDANDIDFEAERNKSTQNTQTVNIDTVDPNSSRSVELEQMLEFLENNDIHASWFPEGHTKESFINQFRSELASGTLSAAFADNVYNEAIKLATK